MPGDGTLPFTETPESGFIAVSDQQGQFLPVLIIPIRNGKRTKIIVKQYSCCNDGQNQHTFHKKVILFHTVPFPLHAIIHKLLQEDIPHHLHNIESNEDEEQVLFHTAVDQLFFFAQSDQLQVLDKSSELEDNIPFR